MLFIIKLFQHHCSVEYGFAATVNENWRLLFSSYSFISSPVRMLYKNSSLRAKLHYPPLTLNILVRCISSQGKLVRFVGTIYQVVSRILLFAFLTKIKRRTLNSSTAREKTRYTTHYFKLTIAFACSIRRSVVFCCAYKLRHLTLYRTAQFGIN